MLCPRFAFVSFIEYVAGGTFSLLVSCSRWAAILLVCSKNSLMKGSMVVFIVFVVFSTMLLSCDVKVFSIMLVMCARVFVGFLFWSWSRVVGCSGVIGGGWAGEPGRVGQSFALREGGGAWFIGGIVEVAFVI